MTQYLLDNNVGKKNYKDVYIYGFECALSTIGNCMIVLLVGVALGIAGEMMSYMLSYAILRASAGGRHETQHWRCILTYICEELAAIYVLMKLYEVFSRAAILFCLIGSIYLVFRYAPKDCENKRLDKIQKEKFRKRSRRTILVMTFVSASCSFFIDSTILTSAVAGVSMESLMLIERRMGYESSRKNGTNQK
ncbi:putative agrB-like protein 1 [Lachnospiraceae bacterium KM106-2]|nr:putative agrB-like protein 1 [Lachnospiraceae bacterium KM106-2]